MWRRLDLTEDEWIECQRSAAEMSIATRTPVSPKQVAVEFALARAFEQAARAQTHHAASAATRDVHHSSMSGGYAGGP